MSTVKGRASYGFKNPAPVWVRRNNTHVPWVEYHVEKYLRDSKIIQIWLGGGQLARLDVAQSYYPYVSSGK